MVGFLFTFLFSSGDDSWRQREDAQKVADLHRIKDDNARQAEDQKRDSEKMAQWEEARKTGESFKYW